MLQFMSTSLPSVRTIALSPSMNRALRQLKAVAETRRGHDQGGLAAVVDAINARLACGLDDDDGALGALSLHTMVDVVLTQIDGDLPLIDRLTRSEQVEDRRRADEMAVVLTCQLVGVLAELGGVQG